jgi:Flp pilus assembly protein protease CpaA
MQIYFYIITFIFIFINYKIVIKDLREKIIPNKLLLFLIILVPFYYIFLINSWIIININSFILGFFITFLISFLLYYFWIWAAWDAKYLLVLALFIPNIWIIPFIWNISFLTILYLFLFFIYFYIWKSLNSNFRKSLINNIKSDIKNSFLRFLEKWDNKKTYTKKIINFIILFLTIFVSLRLIRLYLVNYYIKNNWDSQLSRFSFIYSFIEKYNIYLLFWILIIYIFIIYFIRYFYKKIIKNRLEIIKQKLDFNKNIFEFIITFILFTFLMFFIVYEYRINSNELIKNLYVIFTYYLILYLIFRILLYSYKITFQIWEIKIKNIKELKIWEIIDKSYLIRLFWEQSSLWGAWNKKWILYPEPNKYFKNIENPISEENVKKLKQIYKIVNNHHIKYTQWYIKNDEIKILKTFSFWWYIFVGFILTYFFENKIITSLLLFFLNKVNNF